MKKKNILMIGMPASGKSTIGVLLAKRLGYSFVDVDLVIQEKTGKLLKEIIAEEGDDGFLRVEEQENLDLDVENIFFIGFPDCHRHSIQHLFHFYFLFPCFHVLITN